MLFRSFTTCDQAPECQGSPIQCEIARQAFELKCSFQPTDQEQQDQLTEIENWAADQAATHGDFDQLAQGGERNTEINLNDQVDLNTLDVAAGSCPTVQPISFNGASISLQSWFDTLCQFAEIIGVLVYIVAAGLYITAIRQGIF